MIASGRGDHRPEPAVPGAGAAPSRLVWSAAVALLASWMIISLRFPPGRDQGVFLWIGDVVHMGGAPYRDAWETKGPLVFALSAAVRTLFEDDLWGIRVLDAVVVLSTLVALVVALRRSGAGRATPWTALVLAVLYTRLGWWDSAQPETWATGCMAGAVCLTIPRDGHPQTAGSLIAAGALAGAAALVKPFFALAWAMPATMLWMAETPERRRRSLSILAAGSLAAGLLALAWLLSYGEGTVSAFLDTHIRFNAGVYASTGGPPALERLRRMGGLLISTPLLPALLLALLALRIIWRSNDMALRLRTLIISSGIWLGIGLAIVFVQGKLWPYQWTPLYPPLALLAGVGVSQLLVVRRQTDSRVPPIVAAALLCWVLLGAATPAKWVAAWMRDTLITPDSERWYAHFGDYDLERGKLPVLARLLRDSVPPGEPVLVWGMEPVVYVLSRRMPPTSYGVNLPLVLGTDTPTRRRAHQQFAADLAAHRPYAIVVLDGDRNQLLKRSSREMLDQVPELQQLLTSSYVPGRRVAAGEVYFRRDKSIEVIQ